MIRAGVLGIWSYANGQWCGSCSDTGSSAHVRLSHIPRNYDLYGCIWNIRCRTFIHYHTNNGTDYIMSPARGGFLRNGQRIRDVHPPTASPSWSDRWYLWSALATRSVRSGHWQLHCVVRQEQLRPWFVHQHSFACCDQEIWYRVCGPKLHLRCSTLSSRLWVVVVTIFASPLPWTIPFTEGFSAFICDSQIIWKLWAVFHTCA